MSALHRLLGTEPRALLFDLDGTLIDSVPDIAVATDAMLLELGHGSVSESQVRQWVGNGARKLVARALAHSHSCAVSQLDETQIGSAHQVFLKHYTTSNGQHSRLFAGVAEALERWREQSIAMAIVTNKPIEFVPHLLSTLQIADYFSIMLGGECVPQRKPHPAMLLAACEQLNLGSEHCVMVGDSRNDVEAARAADIPVVAVDYGYNHGRPVKEERPDLLVSNLCELL